MCIDYFINKSLAFKESYQWRLDHQEWWVFDDEYVDEAEVYGGGRHGLLIVAAMHEANCFWLIAAIVAELMHEGETELIKQVENIVRNSKVVWDQS